MATGAPNCPCMSRSFVPLSFVSLLSSFVFAFAAAPVFVLVISAGVLGFSLGFVTVPSVSEVFSSSLMDTASSRGQSRSSFGVFRRLSSLYSLLSLVGKISVEASVYYLTQVFHPSVFPISFGCSCFSSVVYRSAGGRSLVVRGSVITEVFRLCFNRSVCRSSIVFVYHFSLLLFFLRAS